MFDWQTSTVVRLKRISMPRLVRSHYELLDSYLNYLLMLQAGDSRIFMLRRKFNIAHIFYNENLKQTKHEFEIPMDTSVKYKACRN